MHKLTKVINCFFIPTLFVIIIFLLLPLGMSFWIKNNYLQFLRHIRHIHNINLKLIKFERGWFTSNVLIQIILPIVNKNNLPLQFIFKQRILNGPYLFEKIWDKKRIHFAKGLIYTTSEEPNFVFHASTLIHFSNANETIIQANQINFTNGQQYINFQNLTFKVKYDPNNHQWTSNATAKSLIISEQQHNLIIFNNLFLYNTLQQLINLSTLIFNNLFKIDSTSRVHSLK